MEVKPGMFLKIMIDADAQNIDFNIDTYRVLKEKLEEIQDSDVCIEESMRSELTQVLVRASEQLAQMKAAKAMLEMMQKVYRLSTDKD